MVMEAFLAELIVIVRLPGVDRSPCQLKQWSSLLAGSSSRTSILVLRNALGSTFEIFILRTIVLSQTLSVVLLRKLCPLPSVILT